MDDLDLEKLKQELDDVSGDDRYDVDDILREAGADTTEAGGEELDQLMKQFGITVEQDIQPEEAPTAPVRQDETADDPAGVHLAAQQTEALAAQQDELAREAKATAPSDPLEEQEELFAQLFTQLDEIEQHPLSELLDPPTQAMPAEQETQALQADEPDVVESDELDESEQPVQPEPAEQPDEGEPEDADETEPEDIGGNETGTEDTEETPKKGFFARLFGFDEEDEADEDEEAVGEEEEIDGDDEAMDDEPGESDAAELPDEPEQMLTEDEPDEHPTATDAEASKKGFFARLFGFDEADEDAEQGEDAQTEAEAPELDTVPDEPEAADEPAQKLETTEQPDAAAEGDTTDEQPEDAGVAAFADALAQEAAVGATEETPEPPRPRPEDTPVISEQELEEFLSSVKTEDDAPHASFEQLLRDNGLEIEKDEPKTQKISLEKFPDEETTVYVDVPVREPAAQPEKPEVFDIEAEDAAFVEQDTPDEPEQADDVRQLLDEPVEDPDWLELPLERVSEQAPPLEELRQEGPVMAREVARQKDWLLERIRAYQQSLKQEEQPDEPEEPEEIHAADELHAMQQQDSDEERDSVFPDRSVDKPETESADRESTLTDEQDTLQATQPIHLDLPERQTAQQQAGRAPRSAPRNPAAAKRKSAYQPRHAAAKPQRAVWPKEEAPQDMRRAEKSWRLRAQWQARRSIPVLLCTLVAIYISCAGDFSLPLPASLDYVANPGTVLRVLIGLQLVAMLFAYDLIWEGVQAAQHLTPNFSTLVDLALLLNLIHCAVRMAAEGEEIPFVCIALMALFAQMRARCAFSGARHYAFKTAANAHQPMGLFYHDGKRPHVVKAPLNDVRGFAQQTVQPDENWKQERILTVLAVVFAVVLSVIVSVSTGDAGRIWYVLAATVTGACQISLLGAAAMAQVHAARHMAKNGAAVAGRRGAHSIASADTVVLTDNDLFPAGTIALQKLELRSNLNDATALAYAAALAGDSSLGHMLAEEVRTRYGAPLMAHHVVHYADGGIGGLVGGLEVLLGDADFMAQRGMIVRDVPENGLVLALDHDVSAVMVIDYVVPVAQYTAMHELTERNLTILLHTRNQQVTPELVERLYALKKGTVILPELEQDRAMQSPRYTKDDALCGLLVRDGLVPLANCVATSKEQTQFTQAGGVIGVCAAFVCMLLMTYLCYIFMPSDARPIRMLIYAILCFIPIFFLENGVGRD